METDHLINCIRHIERRMETAYLNMVFLHRKQLEHLLSNGPTMLFAERTIYLEMRAEVLERTGKTYGFYHHETV